MFDKFGEFDSFSEINELAENLLNEGDIESLKVVAKENGIQADFVDLYANGEIPELCDKLTAALGKIDVEAAEGQWFCYEIHTSRERVDTRLHCRRKRQ